MKFYAILGDSAVLSALIKLKYVENSGRMTTSKRKDYGHSMEKLTEKEIQLIERYRKTLKNISPRFLYKLSYISLIIISVVAVMTIIGIIILPFTILMAIHYKRIYKYYDLITSRKNLRENNQDVKQSTPSVDVATFVPKVESNKKEDSEQVDKYAIPVTDIHGNVEKMSWLSKTTEDSCLISDGGKTYHTHAGCYLNWPTEYQTGFKGWKKISIAEAEELGYRKCKYCEDKDTPKIQEYHDDWEDYENEKPIKKFTLTHCDEFATIDDYEIGAEVTEGYDDEKDKDILEIDFDKICNMPKSVRDFLDETYESVRMFVIDIYEDDNTGKVKFKVGAYIEK